MTKFYLYITFLFASSSLFGQASYTWNVIGSSGDYQIASNWTPARTTIATTDILIFNASSDIEVSNIPNQTIGALQIASGTSSVTLKTNNSTNILTLSGATPLLFTTNGSILSGDLLTISIASGAAFTLSNGTFGIAASTGGKININRSITVSGGTLLFDVAGTGGTTINSSGAITYNSGNFSSLTPSAITWVGGATYTHNADGTFASAIPASIWNTNANCVISGLHMGSIIPTGFTASTFSNIHWNCSMQASDINLNFGAIPILINGTLTIANTNNKILTFGGSAGANISAGNYAQTNGIVELQNGANTTVLTVLSSFSHTGGTLNAIGGSSAGIATLDVKGNLTKAATWQSTGTNTANVFNLQLSGTNAQTVSISGTWNAPANGRSNVLITNSDLSSGVTVTGNLRVFNTNSGVAAVASIGGKISGNSFNYTNSGAGTTTLSYNGTQAQTATASEFPTSNGPINLSINNSLGVSFPGSFNKTITGTLSLLNGNLSIGTGNTLTLSNTNLGNQLVHTAGFITSGTLSRYFPTSGLPTNGTTVNSRFPFGTGVNDRSVNVYFSGAALTGGTAGFISISHTPIIGITTIAVTDGIALDKRTNSSWSTNVSGFNIGSGGQTISLTTQGNNIGSITDISLLRLTDGVAAFGTVITATGTIDAPLIGKSNLSVADITSKTFYYGSNATNALQIITYTWIGGSNTSWTNASNWSPNTGYPSSQSQIAILNTASPNQPTINSGTSISVYQLTVGSGVTLTLAGTGSLNVADAVTFTGNASFSSTSTFTYSSTSTTQNIISATYGNLTVSGAGSKILPATLTVTGNYSVTGSVPDPFTNNNTFIYAGAGSQRIAGETPAIKYYNLTISGNRGGGSIRLGNTTAANIIEISNIFNVSGLSNYTTIGDFNTIDFKSAGTQTIPGFLYRGITNTGNGPRILDNLGSTNPNNVIHALTLSRGGSAFTVTNSKVKFYVSGGGNAIYGGGAFHDLEIAGNLNGYTFDYFNDATISIAGNFTFGLTNYVHGSNTYTFNFNGTGDQTISAYKTTTGTNTPAFKYSNINFTGGNRNIIFANADTIFVRGNTFNVTSAFTAGKGFITTGSTVNFVNGSSAIPALTPASGTHNYNNIVITGGTRALNANTSLAGNLSIIGSDATPAQLTVGNGSAARILNVLGNLQLIGTSSVSAVTSQIDMNTGSGSSIVNVGGNVSITGTSLLTTSVGNANGTILFNGTNQQYSNTSPFKNGNINFTIGNGTNPTLVTLNNHLQIVRSSTAPFGGIITIANNAILNVGTFNINIANGTSGNATLNVLAGATLTTANTGGLEGAATSSASGAILNTSDIVKNYNSGASYVFNGATTTPFPTAISTMANLTIGAAVSLNQAITATGTLDLGENILTQANNNLQFSGLTSTTGSIAADKNSTISIAGSVGTVGNLRFAPSFNTTGEFTINRPVTVALASDLIIDKTPLSGNYISGSSSSILDLNDKSLTINGTISGPGTFSGSSLSSLTLGGNGVIGTLNFTVNKRVLKNLTLSNSAKATLGTALDIAAGVSPGYEGTVSVTGTATLTTGGNLTIKSNEFGTARIAQGDAFGGYISGDVTIERYIASSTKRGWRMLAAPTYGQTIKQAWQENQAAGVNGNPGFGTILTSNASNWAALGFDYQSPGNSFLSYNPTSNNWVSVANTSLPFANSGGNKAYMVFIRGDRNATPSNGPTSSATILRSKGSIFQGNQPPISVSTPGQFAVIGNNFASAIDFTTTIDGNMDQTYSVWDPKLVGAYGLGGYQTFTASNAWKPTPGGGSYPAGVANTTIQSGQAFAVYTTTGNGNVTLKENGKVSGSQMVFRPIAQAETFRTNLYAINGNDALLADGNTIVFNDNFSNSVDSKDAIKPGNVGENLGIEREGKILVVEARQEITNNDTIFYNTKKLKAQTYRLEFIPERFTAVVSAYLIDNYLHTTTEISTLQQSTVDIVINSDALSNSSNRFMLVFKKSAPLPVTFTTIKATKENNNVVTEWTVENELNINSYDVEKSTNGISFNKIGNTLATGNNTRTNITYNWLDENPIQGDNFYRIKSIGTDGSIKYSRIVKVNMGKIGVGFLIYPNPVKDNTFGLQLKNVTTGIYNTRLINNQGQVIAINSIYYLGGVSIHPISPKVLLPNGTYVLEITQPDGVKNNINVLVSK